MKEQIMKIQRRKHSVFVTIPNQYVDKIKNSTHMMVRENDFGNLEYKPIEKQEKVE